MRTSCRRSSRCRLSISRLSGYDGVLTLTTVTPRTARRSPVDFLDALLEELPDGDELEVEQARSVGYTDRPPRP